MSDREVHTQGLLVAAATTTVSNPTQLSPAQHGIAALPLTAHPICQWDPAWSISRATAQTADDSHVSPSEAERKD